MNTCLQQKIGLRSFEKAEHGYFLFSCLIGLFTLSLMLRDMAGLPVPKLLIIAASALIFLIGDRNQILAFLAFITPLSIGIPYVTIEYIALLFIFFKSSKITIGHSIIFPFVIVFIEAVHTIFSPDDTLWGFLRPVIMILLMTLLFLDTEEDYDYRFILKMYLLGYMVLVLFSVFMIGQTGSIDKFFEMGTTLGRNVLEGAEGTRIFAGNNDMGIFSTITVAISMLLLLTNQGNKLIMTFILVTGFAMGFMATSRGAVFSSIFCLLISILFSVKSPKKLFKAVLITSVFVLVALILIHTVLSGAYATFMKKMQLADLSNGRFSIFAIYNRVYLSDPGIFLTGVGMQNYVDKCRAPNSIHNAIQEVLVTWGLLGFICVAGFFIALYRNAVRHIPKCKRALIFMMPAIVFLFRAQFGRIFSNGIEAMVMIVIYCSMALNSQISGRAHEENTPPSR